MASVPPVLHLALAPQAATRREPELLVWGEAADGEPAGLQVAGVPAHPGAAGHQRLWQALTQAVPSLAPLGQERLPEGWRHTVQLTLPWADGRPVPSPYLLGHPPRPAPLRPVLVPTLRLVPAALAALLEALHRPGAADLPFFRPGVAVVPLLELYRSALVAWEQGLVYPYAGDRTFLRTPRWRAAVHHPVLAASIARAAEALPPAFWAAFPPSAGRAQPEAAQEVHPLLVDLLEALVHQLSVRWRRPGPAMAAPSPRSLGEAFRLLLAALDGHAVPPALPTPFLAEAAGRLAAWSAPLSRKSPLHPWWLVVRLEDRSPAEADGAPELVLSAQLWRPWPPTLRPLDPPAVPEDPPLPEPRAVRQLLGAVAPAVPGLAARLREGAGPWPVSGQEALDLMDRGLARWTAQGVLVELPAWWREVSAPPVRLQAVAVPADAPSGLGLDRLIDLDWRVEVGGRPVDPQAVARLAQARTPLVRLGGRWYRLSPAQLMAAAHRLRRSRLKAAEALRLALAGPEEAGLEVTVQARGWLADLATAQGPPPPRPAPPGLATALRPYQAVGFAWLARLTEQGLGALLADDMGLGKTVQLIALLLDRKARGLSAGPTLLVCPTSVLTNWQRELARFAPSLSVRVHHGPQRRVGRGRTDLVLTTYALLWRDQARLSRTLWDGVVLDEAQAIKNPRAKAAAAARALRSRWRAALTGTPVENRLVDLWSLMAFLNPGYLGSLAAFRRRFARPMEGRQDPVAAQNLRRLTGPFLLRRVKTDPQVVQDLPEKIEIEEACRLTAEQASLYRAQVEALRRALAAAPQGMQRRALVATTLTRLKQICNHPRHFRGDASPFTAARSGKLERLEELLEEALSEGDRVLVFTQYVTLGQLLGPFLSHRLGREVPLLHGGLSRRQRMDLVDRFQEGKGAPVLLLSLKAGGVGLNLTAASRVIHYDRWWNPAVEDQATDRAYRIGQARRVMVHALVSSGTVEEKVAELLRRKRHLAQQVVGAGEGWLTELPDAELLSLVQLGPGGSR